MSIIPFPKQAPSPFVLLILFIFFFVVVEQELVQEEEGSVIVVVQQEAVRLEGRKEQEESKQGQAGVKR